jgi:chromosome segregation and condensation protein ScpB
MVRTQIYLTPKERQELAALARTTGKKQSELIREAVDRLVEESSKRHREVALARAAGMWKHRTDLPDFEQIRRELDRDRS